MTLSPLHKQILSKHASSLLTQCLLPTSLLPGHGWYPLKMASDELADRTLPLTM